jgi:hypothetical protein
VDGTVDVTLHQLHPYVSEEGIEVERVTITGTPCKAGATCSWPATRSGTTWTAAVDTTLLEPGPATLKATARFPIVANPASIHEEGPSIPSWSATASRSPASPRPADHPGRRQRAGRALRLLHAQ